MSAQYCGKHCKVNTANFGVFSTHCIKKCFLLASFIYRSCNLKTYLHFVPCKTYQNKSDMPIQCI